VANLASWTGQTLSQARERIGDALGRPRRWRYLEQVPSDAVCAEIGVFRGKFTRDILRVTRPRELHLIDAWWTLVPDKYPVEWGDYWGSGALTSREAYEETLQVANDRCTVHVGDDLEILEAFPDRYFDWVYLDSSHEYQHTVEELELLDKKVKGLVLGDDWKPDPGHVHHGVYRAVLEFCDRGEWEVLDPDPIWDQWAVRRRR